MLTVQDFINAARKNGYEIARNGNFINPKNGYQSITDKGDDLYDKPELVGSACFAGQAGINLKMNPWLLCLAIEFAINDTFANKLAGMRMLRDLYNKNDRTYANLDEIATYIESTYPTMLNIDIEPYLSKAQVDLDDEREYAS
jgi:hypothetical protein